MPLFIKTENFTEETQNLNASQRKSYIMSHKQWVNSLIASGVKVASGYLVNKEGKPGGGGVLIIQARNLEEAKAIIQKDPMIASGIVTWEIKEWNQICASNLIF